MGAEASSSLMTFSTHLLTLEPDYDNEKYKASPQSGRGSIGTNTSYHTTVS
jgi:hypothetical protein